jgi:hypothetical protein
MLAFSVKKFNRTVRNLMLVTFQNYSNKKSRPGQFPAPDGIHKTNN